MTRRLYTIQILLLLAIAAFGATSKMFVLVIDAGHGGHDAGAVGSFSKEKNINLKTALAFGRYVEQNCRDVKVIYTRKTDVFVPLHERANIANRNHADAFISIHTNSLPAGRIARGFETYTMGMRRSDEKLSAAQRENSVITIEKDYQEHYAGYDPNSPESAIMFEFIHDKNMAKSVELAKAIQKGVCQSAGRPDKGVKQDVFLVLRETSMPACLVELGFISTPEEERLLNNEVEIDRMAYAMYAAFVKYRNKTAVIPPYKDMTPTLPRMEEKAATPATEVQSEKTSVKEKRNRKSNPSTTPKAQDEVKGGSSTGVKESKEATSEKQRQTVQEKPAQSAPVFKVQFLTSTRVLSSGASQFKGVTGANYYRDGSTIKYTIGECSSFAEASQLRKTIVDKFPDAFIVAFMNGQRMDLNEARDWKR